MKKIAHIFLPHQFARTAAPFLCNNFNHDVFIMHNTKGVHSVSNIEGAYYMHFSSFKEELSIMIGLIDKYDYVYTHSMFLSPQIKIGLMLLRPKCLDKIVWIEWGYDLYALESGSLKELLKNGVKRFVQLLFDRNIKNFVAIHPVDIEVFKKRFRNNANVHVVQYRFSKGCDDFTFNYKKIQIKDKILRGEPIVIQINHRAEPDFLHEKVLNQLKAYRNENIKILLPLSYGDQEYADRIEKYAIDIFGKDKVWSLRKFVDLTEYRKILGSVDIFVLHTNRQVALGNIFTMFYLQKKIYLPEDSSLYRFFVGNGLHIDRIEELGQIPFDSIASDVDTQTARKYIEEFYAEDPKTMWSELFNNVENKKL